MIAASLPMPVPPRALTEPPADAAEAELTIDDLAAVARVPSRTIRFYQSRGALMAPDIRGRVAYYGQPHVERLKWIAQLQDRGLRIDAIGDLMKKIDRGELDLGEWLGVQDQMQKPWASDQPRTASEEELYELWGSRRPGLIAALIKERIIERKGDVYLIESPSLFAVAMKLERVGIDLSTAVEASAILRKHLGRAVAELVELFVDRVKDGRVVVASTTGLFDAFRTAGIDAVRVIFAREMEGALRKLGASGKLASLSSRIRGRRKP